MPAYITLTHYRPSSRPALMWPLHKLASHQFKCLDGTAVRGFAKYLELSHDKKRQQQMKHIKAARGTHKMLFSSFRSQDGPRRPECFWIYGPLPHAAACSPRADVGAIKTNRPLSFHHPLSDNARGEERSGVFSAICTHKGSEQLWALTPVLVLEEILILVHHKQSKNTVSQNLLPQSKKNIYSNLAAKFLIVKSATFLNFPNKWQPTITCQLFGIQTLVACWNAL